MTTPTQLRKVVQDPNADMLEVVDKLRAMIAAGNVVAFSCVVIEPDDGTRMFGGQRIGGNQTRLRMMGAIAHLQHCYHAGTDID